MAQVTRAAQLPPDPRRAHGPRAVTEIGGLVEAIVPGPIGFAARPRRYRIRRDARVGREGASQGHAHIRSDQIMRRRAVGLLLEKGEAPRRARLGIPGRLGRRLGVAFGDANLTIEATE